MICFQLSLYPLAGKHWSGFKNVAHFLANGHDWFRGLKSCGHLISIPEAFIPKVKFLVGSI